MPKPVEVARSYLAVREEPKGSNRSPEIDRWLAAIGSPLASPWCAAFVYGCVTESGDRWCFAKSGRVQTLVESGVLTHASTAQPGDLVVFWFPSLNRYAHIGIVVTKTSKRLTTIEGNTIPDGATGDTREGYGVFEKSRAISDRVKVLRPRDPDVRTR